MKLKKRQRPKHHHFVTQAYLKGFSPDEAHVWMFKKESQEAEWVGVKNVAQENGLYDLPADVIAKLPEQYRDAQIAEKALADLDARFIGFVRQIIREVDATGHFTMDTAMWLALHVVRQMLRTRRARNHLSETHAVVARTLFEEHLRQNHPHLLPCMDMLEVGYRPQDLALLQVQQLFDSDNVADHAELLMEHYWVVGVNHTVQPFYTSDNPVVRRANVDRPGHRFNGLRSPGIEIAFPLSSRQILLMYERSYFADWAHMHGKAVAVDAFAVERYNCLQVHQSHRQVYCQTDQFEQARGECRLHPEVCKLDRPHVEVVREGDKVGFLFGE